MQAFKGIPTAPVSNNNISRLKLPVAAGLLALILGLIRGNITSIYKRNNNLFNPVNPDSSPAGAVSHLGENLPVLV